MTEETELKHSSDSPSKTRGGKGALRNTKHVINLKSMKFLRRQLRNNSTPAEAALWRILKGKQVAGLQFRRQYSIDKYILDFYCPALRLAIELDGDYHNCSSAQEHDKSREEELFNEYGINTLRFENRLVFEQPNSIVYAISKLKNY